MSLLWMDYEKEFQDLVEAAYQWEYHAKEEYFSKLPQRVQRIIYRDTRYNVDFLYTAYVMKDAKIMEKYAAWLFVLMDGILKQFTREQTAKYVIEHFEAIKQGIKLVVSVDKKADLTELVTKAQKAVEDALAAGEPQPEAAASPFEAEIKQYMDSLFEKNNKKTMFLVKEFLRKGISVDNIYVGILAESMRRVGELWHNAKITVDMEHYCTSATQLAMTQLYPEVFAAEPQDKTLLCACPGTELHEMGARIVADVFENNGWNSIYLGAAVPEDYMLNAVRENRPDLVALSVTMPQHLIDCERLVKAIKKEFPKQKIAVGGRAFMSTDEIWKQWPADFYAENALDLLKKARN